MNELHKMMTVLVGALLLMLELFWAIHIAKYDISSPQSHSRWRAGRG